MTIKKFEAFGDIDEKDYVAYRLSLIENKEVVFKLKNLKKTFNDIDGLEAYSYKLTSTLYTIIVVITDNTNSYLQEFCLDKLQTVGRNVNNFIITESDLSQLRKMK